MGFHIEFSDITKYKGDVIVNSLGINGNIYGRLCKNIIKAANSPTVKNFIDSKLNNKIGQLFVTDAGDLPCKKIIHVVTPFKDKDDDQNTLLTQAYKSAIDMAINHGYKSIGLPFIGTGANGYTDIQTYEAITNACEYLMKLEEKQKEIIHVTIIGYLNKSDISLGDLIIERNYYKGREFNKKNDDFMVHMETCCSLPQEEPKEKADEFKKCLMAMSYYDPYQDGINVRAKGYKYPYEYIKDYLKQTNQNDKFFKKCGLSADNKYKLSLSKSFKKKTIYKLAYMCHMKLSDLIQFMMVCETGFSPFSKLDLFMIEYFKGHMFDLPHPYKFAEAVKKFTGEDIFDLE